MERKFIYNHAPSKSHHHIQLHNDNLKVMIAAKAAAPVNKLSSSFSLSSKYKLPILDQGNLGSCVANSFAGIMQSLRNISPSRLYLYFVARNFTGCNSLEDTGLDLLQSIPSFQQFGCPTEQLWAYNTAKFAQMPPVAAYKNGLQNLINIISAPIPQTADGIKMALSKNSFVMFGFSVYDSFETIAVANTGLVPVPNTKTEKNLGGHCVHIVGWLPINGLTYYIVRNSWGTSWGNNGATTYDPKFKNNGTNGGFFYMPEQYILNPILAFEFISIS